jgi:hypothetical protein
MRQRSNGRRSRPKPLLSTASRSDGQPCAALHASRGQDDQRRPPQRPQVRSHLRRHNSVTNASARIER